MTEANAPTTIPFEIKRRFGRPSVTVEIDASVEGALLGVRLGAAVRVAIKAGADLRGADLRGAVLRGADLRGADLEGADLTGADLRGADLRGADLRGAVLGGARGVPKAASVQDLDGKILAAIEAGGALDMSEWHTCGSTHCRAGWAIIVAGEKGALLEELLGPSTAGALIYAASYPDLPIPDFSGSADPDVVMADIRARAALADTPEHAEA